MKKLISLLFSILLLTSFMPVKIYAQTATLVKGEWQAQYQTKNTDYTYYEMWWGRAQLSGKTAYCIDPTTHATDKGKYQSSDFFDSLPSPQQELMWKYAYYGYGYNGDNNVNRYMAAQKLIWEQMSPNQVHPESGDKRKFKIEWTGAMNQGDLDKINEYEQEILDLVATYDLKPSFLGSTQKVKVGDTITLTDENEVLKNFDITLPSGMELVSNKGNTLKVRITSKDVNGQSIEVTRKSQPTEETSIVWELTNSQRLFTHGRDYYDPTTGVVKFELKSGGLKLIKEDETGARVPNTSFTLSYNPDMTSPIGTFTTKEDGTITIPELDIKTVYIQEVSVPEDLVLDNTIYNVNIIPGETITYKATNIKKRGSLEITKVDDEGNSVSNTSFKLSYNSDMSDPIGTYTTGSNGTVRIDNLLAKTVYVQETKVSVHLLLDNSIKSVNVAYNTVTPFRAVNNWKKGDIEIIKKDVDTGKVVVAANTSFDVFTKDGNFVKTITTDNTGKAKATGLKYGEYYLVEKTAPNKYLINNSRVEYQILENGRLYSNEISNKRVSGTINLSKNDSKTGKDPLGDASLQGAVYGLYARNNILDPADNSVIYKAGQKVADLTTDSNGNASIQNLYLGEYYIQEIKASEGYLLDTQKYNVDLSYKDQNTSVITQSKSVNEVVKRQAFQVIKTASDGSSESGVPLLQGVEFTYILKDLVDKYGSFDKALANVSSLHSDEWGVMVTDSKGYAKSKELPYGTYVVKETKTLDNLYPANDF